MPSKPFIQEAAALFAIRWNDDLSSVSDLVDMAIQSGHAAPLVIADLITDHVSPPGRRGSGPWCGGRSVGAEMAKAFATTAARRLWLGVPDDRRTRPRPAGRTSLSESDLFGIG